MHPSSFARALDEAIDHLGISRTDFAKSVKISQSLVSKVLAGEEVHRKTLKKIFSFLTKVSPKHAQAALRACLRDLASDVAPGISADASSTSSSRNRSAAVLGAFGQLSTTMILALETVATAAEQDESVHNSLMALADLVARKVAGHPELGRQFFAPAVVKPPLGRRPGKRQEFRLIGGSVGDFISALNEEE